MEIRESETGMVRVFHLDLPNEAIERYTVQAGTGEWPLMYGMGAKKLSAAFIDVVRLQDLEDMPLSRYLSEAHNIPPETLAEDAPRLNKLRGHVLIFPSQAFVRTAQTLSIRTPLRWIGTYEEHKSRTMAPPLRSKAAKGRSSAGAAPQAPGLGTILKVVFVGLAVLFVVIALWIVMGG